MYRHLFTIAVATIGTAAVAQEPVSPETCAECDNFVETIEEQMAGLGEGRVDTNGEVPTAGGGSMVPKPVLPVSYDIGNVDFCEDLEPGDPDYCHNLAYCVYQAQYNFFGVCDSSWKRWLLPVCWYLESKLDGLLEEYILECADHDLECMDDFDCRQSTYDDFWCDFSATGGQGYCETSGACSACESNGGTCTSDPC